MRKLLLIPILLLFFIGGCSQPKDHAYVSVEPAVFIPPTTTTTIPPTTTTTVKAKVVEHSTKSVSRSAARPTTGIAGVCGGVLPPCWVLDRESGHNDGNPNTYDIHAKNPSGCSGRGCYGKWQCDPNSCDGTGTEEQQNAEAARLWDNGRGCSHWAAC